MLPNGTLVVAWGPGVLEWSPAPHEGLLSRYIHCTKKHALRVLTAVQLHHLHFREAHSMACEWC